MPQGKKAQREHENFRSEERYEFSDKIFSTYFFKQNKKS